MVDGISFLTTGATRGESTAADRANKLNDDRNATFGVSTASDIAARSLDQSTSLKSTQSSDTSNTARAQSTQTSTAPSALLSASASNVLLDAQAQRTAPTPNDTNRLDPPTRGQQQIETAVKAFDNTQSRTNATAPAQKPQYFNASVRISV